MEIGQRGLTASQQQTIKAQAVKGKMIFLQGVSMTGYHRLLASKKSRQQSNAIIVTTPSRYHISCSNFQFPNMTHVFKNGQEQLV